MYKIKYKIPMTLYYETTIDEEDMKDLANSAGAKNISDYIHSDENLTYAADCAYHALKDDLYYNIANNIEVENITWVIEMPAVGLKAEQETK